MQRREKESKKLKVLLKRNKICCYNARVIG